MSGKLVRWDDDSGDGCLGKLIEAPPDPAAAIPFTGIRALMLALLDDGVRAYLGPVPRARQEAEHWVHEGRRRHVFAFDTVCETLGLEPGAVRRALRTLQRDSPAALQPAMPRRLRPNGRRQAGFGLAVQRSPADLRPPSERPT